LRDWLKATGVTHVGMESTGVYWWPVYSVLEGSFVTGAKPVADRLRWAVRDNG
jgi:hypothetical protein